MSKPAIFVDRDGVLNKEIDGVLHPDDFSIERGAIEAVKLANANGFLVVVISNQAWPAKGMCEIADIERVNSHMLAVFAEQGAIIDAVYYCPYKKVRGPNTNPVYAKDSEFRKPNIGMIRQAVAELYIDLFESAFIGDTTSDYQTAHNAGILAIGVKTGYAGKDGKCDAKPDVVVETALEGVKLVLNRRAKKG